MHVQAAAALAGRGAVRNAGEGGGRERAEPAQHQRDLPREAIIRSKRGR